MYLSFSHHVCYPLCFSLSSQVFCVSDLSSIPSAFVLTVSEAPGLPITHPFFFHFSISPKSLPKPTIFLQALFNLPFELWHYYTNLMLPLKDTCPVSKCMEVSYVDSCLKSSYCLLLYMKTLQVCFYWWDTCCSLAAFTPLQKSADNIWFLRYNRYPNCQNGLETTHEDNFWRVFGEALEDLETCGQSELLREIEVNRFLNLLLTWLFCSFHKC